MSIELRTFASGDTDYIAKLNANVAALKEAIDALQLQAGGASGVNEISVGAFWNALFNNEDCLIGPSSYVPTQASTTVSVSPGGFYLADTQTPVSKATATTLTLTGQTSGIKYITIDGVGSPTLRTTREAGAAYSVFWSGSAFVGQPIRIAACLFDAAEATASRESTALGLAESPPEDITFKTLDERLEMAEEIAVQAKEDASTALAIVYEAGFVPPARIRKIGCTVNNVAGPKGMIQIDFKGTIVGWSIIGSAPGTISVSVSRKGSSPPPAAPGIPSPTTDKISAAAPIALTGGQSASKDSVPTWNANVFPWDVLQFNVDAPGSVPTATLYLRIQEA